MKSTQSTWVQCIEGPNQSSDCKYQVLQILPSNVAKPLKHSMIVNEDANTALEKSVTKWLDYLFNIWPFTTKKLLNFRQI